jgi:hypothetical protein
MIFNIDEVTVYFPYEYIYKEQRDYMVELKVCTLSQLSVHSSDLVAARVNGSVWISWMSRKDLIFVLCLPAFARREAALHA